MLHQTTVNGLVVLAAVEFLVLDKDQAVVKVVQGRSMVIAL